MPEYENLLNEYDELAKNNSASSKSGSAFGALDNNKNSGKSPHNSINKKNGSHSLQENGFSNIAGNKFGKNGGLGNTPEALKRRGSNMPGVAPGGMPGMGNSPSASKNSLGGGNSLGNDASKGKGTGADRLGPALNSMMGSKQEAEQKEKGIAQKVAEEAATQGTSAVAQSFGIPKPLADMIAKKFVDGPGFKLLIVSCAVTVSFYLLIFLVILCLLIFPIVKGLQLVGDVKEGINEFANSAENWFSGNGWCPDEATCEAKAEEKFYDKVESLAKDYPRIDMSLVMASVLYGYNPSNGMFNTGNIDYCEKIYQNETDEEQKKEKIAKCESQTAEGTAGTEGYKEAKDNLSKVAKKLSRGVEEFDDYMVNEFIPKNHGQIMEQNNKTSEQILKEIYIYSKFFESFRKSTTIISGNGVCSYTLNGVDVSDIKVRLLECSWNPSDSPKPIAGEELVDFEKYIMGVTYGESYGFADEEYKAQAIAARSFSLVRPNNMAGVYGDQLKLEEEDGKWILQVRNCIADHVYCDPDKGCWTDSSVAGDTVHSGYEAGHAWSKEPLPEDDRLREAVKSVRGMVLVDASGNIINTEYTHTEQTNWNNWAKNGLDYNQILKKQYTNGNSIISNCTAGLTGDWAAWRQYDPKWANIKLGSVSLGNYGCLMTSFAIQIARSGTAIYLPSGVTEFNPGVFVQHSGVVFDADGYYQGGDPWTKGFAPGFVRHENVSISGTKKQKIQKMAEYINQGYYPIIQVKYPECKGCVTHFVAVIGTTNDDILMADPASESTEVFAKYPTGASSSYSLYTSLFKRTD